MGSKSLTADTTVYRSLYQPGECRSALLVKSVPNIWVLGRGVRAVVFRTVLVSGSSTGSADKRGLVSSESSAQAMMVRNVNIAAEGKSKPLSHILLSHISTFRFTFRCRPLAQQRPSGIAAKQSKRCPSVLETCDKKLR